MHEPYLSIATPTSSRFVTAKKPVGIGLASYLGSLKTWKAVGIFLSLFVAIVFVGCLVKSKLGLTERKPQNNYFFLLSILGKRELEKIWHLKVGEIYTLIRGSNQISCKWFDDAPAM